MAPSCCRHLRQQRALIHSMAGADPKRKKEEDLTLFILHYLRTLLDERAYCRWRWLFLPSSHTHTRTPHRPPRAFVFPSPNQYMMKMRRWRSHKSPLDYIYGRERRGEVASIGRVIEKKAHYRQAERKRPPP